MRTMMLITILVLMTTMMAKANPVTTWIESEKNKIVEYQKSSWEEGKEQNAENWTKIKSFFTNLIGQGNASQN
jgi:hypothetical protein